MNNVIQKASGLLRILLKYPEREFTILELSKEASVPYATSWRTVQSLSKQGIILTKTIGKSTVCKLNTKSPLLKEIKLLTGLELSPHRAALKEFVSKAKKLKAINNIILFGSVAKGTEKPSSDVDVALFVDKKTLNLESQVNEIVDFVLKTSRIKIVPLIFTEKELLKRPHFKKEIEKGELVYERS